MSRDLDLGPRQELRGLSDLIKVGPVSDLGGSIQRKQGNLVHMLKGVRYKCAIEHGQKTKNGQRRTVALIQNERPQGHKVATDLNYYVPATVCSNVIIPP